MNYDIDLLSSDHDDRPYPERFLEVAAQALDRHGWRTSETARDLMERSAAHLTEEQWHQLFNRLVSDDALKLESLVRACGLTGAEMVLLDDWHPQRFQLALAYARHANLLPKR